MNKNHFCIIMAGGLGGRFWPLSTTEKPKQFLDLTGTGRTLIQLTYQRMASICPKENIFIVTCELFRPLIKEQVPDIKDDRVLYEPTRRNTAPCIAYANEYIKELNSEAQIIVTPADHLILNEELYRQAIWEGLEYTKNKDILLTIGIKPNRPETDYGYIQIADPESNKKISEVKNFTEKPTEEMAKIFLQTNEFFWNSGIFIWSLTSITNAFRNHLPETLELFESLNPKQNTNSINNIYAGCKNISIDYGILEKADNVHVYKAKFGWSDLGTWKALFDNQQKTENQNIIKNTSTVIYDTTDCILFTNDKKTSAIQGLEGYIVVDTEDSLLICKRTEEHKIRQIVNDIKFNKGNSEN